MEDTTDAPGPTFAVIDATTFFAHPRRTRARVADGLARRAAVPLASHADAAAAG